MTNPLRAVSGNAITRSQAGQRPSHNIWTRLFFTGIDGFWEGFAVRTRLALSYRLLFCRRRSTRVGCLVHGDESYRRTSKLRCLFCSQRRDSVLRCEKPLKVTPMFRSLIPAFILCSLCTAAAAQTSAPPDSPSPAAGLAKPPTLAEITAAIDERTSSLSGYQSLLQDPNPARALAAAQIMLESGDPNLVRLAMENGLVSPDSSLRAAVMDYYFKSKPTLGIRFTAEAVGDDKLDQLRENILSWNGAMGPDKTGSFSVGVGEFSEKLNCYLWAGAAPDSTDLTDCKVRANAASFSVYLMNQWVDFSPGQDGNFTGGATSNLGRNSYEAHWFVGPLSLTVRLLP